MFTGHSEWLIASILITGHQTMGIFILKRTQITLKLAEMRPAPDTLALMIGWDGSLCPTNDLAVLLQTIIDGINLFAYK